MSASKNASQLRGGLRDGANNSLPIPMNQSSGQAQPMSTIPEGNQETLSGQLEINNNRLASRNDIKLSQMQGISPDHLKSAVLEQPESLMVGTSSPSR